MQRPKIQPYFTISLFAELYLIVYRQAYSMSAYFLQDLYNAETYSLKVMQRFPAKSLNVNSNHRTKSFERNLRSFCLIRLGTSWKAFCIASRCLVMFSCLVCLNYTSTVYIDHFVCACSQIVRSRLEGFSRKDGCFNEQIIILLQPRSQHRTLR